jgi:excinuclease UvrABC nuclease subunit
LDRLKSLVRKIDRLPPDPGVYLFKDSGGKILYVGKAVSLAQERTMARPLSRGKIEEEVYHPRFKSFLALGKHSSLLNFLDSVRDEAHRFAIAYHKKIRSKETIKSVLGEIPGIGPGRQKELLEFFGSVDKIKEACAGELARVPHMSRRGAQAVYDFFRQPRRGDS